MVMEKKVSKRSVHEIKIQHVYIKPMEGNYNIYPFSGGVTTMDIIDTEQTVKKYKNRFSKAWEELADK
jgi:hypothetical protein